MIYQLRSSLFLFAMIGLCSALSILIAREAAASSSEMSGFHFQTCDLELCIEMSATRAAVSHIDFGFTTLSSTALTLKKPNGKMFRELTGTSATYYPEISTVSLEDELNGKTYLISLRTDRVQEFTSEVRK